jgi:3-oxoacyl-[acyl-carrier protein] reductase/meso-butanediol dehydrogenase/(S,S)-butanediol dehydrogenase/diacetyl reductase
MTSELTGLAGNVAIVTGAGRMRSIGRPIAVELARAGCDVVITGTGRAPADYPADEQAAGWRDIESVADEIRALGQRCVPVVSDIADDAAVDALVTRTLEEFGRVDIIVNNAGAARGPDRFNVNLNGTFLLSRAAARHWLAVEQPGCIVNISSVGGKIAGPGTAAYSASKAAIHALGAAMAAELGPSGIRVNAICPGIVDTSRLDDIDRGENWERLRNIIPMRRHGTGEDIANMCVFLCSDQGSWITGQAINVDGGQLTIR